MVGGIDGWSRPVPSHRPRLRPTPQGGVDRPPGESTVVGAGRSCPQGRKKATKRCRRRGFPLHAAPGSVPRTPDAGVRLGHGATAAECEIALPGIPNAPAGRRPFSTTAIRCRAPTWPKPYSRHRLPEPEKPTSRRSRRRRLRRNRPVGIPLPHPPTASGRKGGSCWTQHIRRLPTTDDHRPQPVEDFRKWRTARTIPVARAQPCAKELPRTPPPPAT